MSDPKALTDDEIELIASRVDLRCSLARDGREDFREMRDEIYRLRAENARLREALMELVRGYELYGPTDDPTVVVPMEHYMDRARKALEPK